MRRLGELARCGGLARKGSGRVFDPGMLNPVLWLKADAGLFQDAAGTLPAAADADPVGLWQDQSGSGWHVSQAAPGKRPLLKLAANGLNGRPVVLFSGAQLLYRSLANWLSASTSGTLVAVIKKGAQQANPETLIGSADEPGANNYWLVHAGSNASRFAAVTQANSGAANTVRGDDALLLGSTHILSAASDGSAYSLSVDGQRQTLTVVSGSNSGGWLAAVENRDSLTIGGAKFNGVDAWYFAGSLAQLLVFSPALTPAELTQVHDYLNGLYAVYQDLLAFEGDSLTAGQGVAAGSNYPAQVMASYPNHTHYNGAAAGETIVQMLAQGANFDGRCVARAVLCLLAGTNDIAGADDAQTIYNNLVAYHAARRAAGYRTVAITIPACGTYDAAEETKRLAVNTAIRANWAAFADALADVAADARFQTPSNAEYYQADTVHMTAAGCGALAELVKAALDALM